MVHLLIDFVYRRRNKSICLKKRPYCFAIRPCVILTQNTWTSVGVLILMPYGTYCLRQLLRKYSIRLPESQVYFFIFSISSSFFYYKSKPSRTSFNSFADESNFSFSSSLSIRSCVIFCHIDHIISAILSSRNRKPGAEKISKFYLLSDTKKRTPERMCFLSSARSFLILLFLPSRFYRRG